MGSIFVRYVKGSVKDSLKRMAKRKQKVTKPNLNQYIIDLFEGHTKKEIETFKALKKLNGKD